VPRCQKWQYILQSGISANVNSGCIEFVCVKYSRLTRPYARNAFCTLGSVLLSAKCHCAFSRTDVEQLVVSATLETLLSGCRLVDPGFFASMALASASRIVYSSVCCRAFASALRAEHGLIGSRAFADEPKLGLIEFLDRSDKSTSFGTPPPYAPACLQVPLAAAFSRSCNPFS
jgi:hypothetical protein